MTRQAAALFPAARRAAGGVCGAAAAARGTGAAQRLLRAGPAARAPAWHNGRLSGTGAAALRAGGPSASPYNGGDWCWAVKRRDDEASGGALSCRAPGRGGE